MAIESSFSAYQRREAKKQHGEENRRSATSFQPRAIKVKKEEPEVDFATRMKMMSGWGQIHNFFPKMLFNFIP